MFCRRGHLRKPLLLFLPFLALALASQDEWKARDAWQKPQEVMDVLGKFFAGAGYRAAGKVVPFWNYSPSHPRPPTAL
jgi:hypothetical protein